MFIFLVRLEGFSISCSNLHSDIYLLRFNVYNANHSVFLFHVYLFFVFKCTLTSLFFIETHFVKLLHLTFIDFIINVIICFILYT